MEGKHLAYRTEYDEMIIEVEDFEIGARAVVINLDEDDEDNCTYGTIAEIAACYGDYHGNWTRYDTAAENILCNSNNNVTGEFIEDNDTYYVGIKYDE